MKSFLQYVAEDILHKYGTDLSRITIIFPNKRASLFLNEELVRLSNKPLWSPNYLTISELFRAHSSKSVGDQIKLICDLHKIFNECTGSDETLDHFYGWGQVLLADYDDIDKNHVEWYPRESRSEVYGQGIDEERVAPVEPSTARSISNSWVRFIFFFFCGLL